MPFLITRTDVAHELQHFMKSSMRAANREDSLDLQQGRVDRGMRITRDKDDTMDGALECRDPIWRERVCCRVCRALVTEALRIGQLTTVECAIADLVCETDL